MHFIHMFRSIVRNMGKAEVLESLFVADIPDILAWNSSRDSNDKRKLVLFLDLLYQRFKGPGRATVRPHPTSSDAYVEADDELIPVDEVPHTGCAITLNSNNSSGKKSTITSASGWLRARSSDAGSTVAASSSTGSGLTRFSQLTRTSMNSLPSMSIPTYMMDYQRHKRGFAVNRRGWNPKFNQNTSTPDSPIFPPQVKPINVSGRFTGGSGSIEREHLSGVFKQAMIADVSDFFSNMDSERRWMCMSVIRGLQSMRRLSHHDTVSSRHFSVAEDCRYWNPSKATPVMDNTNTYGSRVFPGALTKQPRVGESDPLTTSQGLFVVRGGSAR